MQGEMNLAMAFAKNANDVREGAVESGGDHADGEIAELTTSSHASQANGFGGLGEGRAGAVEEHDAGLGERDPSSRPVEELDAKLAFELLDLLEIGRASCRERV